MRRVAIVDDDSTALRIMTHTVRSGGHEVTGYNSSLGFLVDFEEGDRWDAYIFDAMMPVPSGVALIQTLHDAGVYDNICLCTGLEGHEYQCLAVAESVRYVPKKHHFEKELLRWLNNLSN